MTYAVKEVFDSLQGEGMYSGTRAVFVRFAGCNLWNGTEEGRTGVLAGPCARWCDTDFLHGVKETAESLAQRMAALWPSTQPYRRCVLTGGEPLLQVDDALITVLLANWWEVAIETNGTVEPLTDVHEVKWLTVAPKRGTVLKVKCADELKVVLPGAADGEAGWTDDELVALEKGGHWNFLLVQPQTQGSRTTIPDAASVRRCVEFVREHPGWRLSVQAHKYLGLR